MSVKNIFLTILGTISFVIVSFIVIEVFNMNVTSSQLTNLTKTSAYQTCALFTQETYKERQNSSDYSGNGGAVDMSDIYDDNGTLYISGDFYNGDTLEEIWKSLYVGNAEFNTTMGALRTQKGYTNLDLLMKGIENSGNVAVSAVDWDSSAAELQANINAEKANEFYREYYTPANLGIPYLDLETTTKIFKWELTQLLSNCDSSNIHTDQNNNRYVMYKGFRCYTSQAEITNVTYKTYRLINDSGSVDSAVAAKLTSDTGLTVSGVNGAATNIGINPKIQTDLAGKKVFDNATVTVAEVDYTLPIAYEGITPVRTWFAYMFNNDNKVQGTGDTTDTITEQEFDDTQQQNLSSANQKAIGTIPTSGKLIYNLVK